MFDLEAARAPGYVAAARDTGVFFVAGALEGTRTQKNSIPGAAQRMAELLRSRGLDAKDVLLIAGEDHDSLKPSLVGRALAWLEQGIARGRSAKGVRTQVGRSGSHIGSTIGESFGGLECALGCART